MDKIDFDLEMEGEEEEEEDFQREEVQDGEDDNHTGGTSHAEKLELVRIKEHVRKRVFLSLLC